MFANEAKHLEDDGRQREAEQLYVAAQLIESAIAMYRRSKSYDNVIRLVKNHQPDMLAKYHSDIGRQLQKEGNRKAAEKHLLAVCSIVNNY